jgi:hypothetical protein
MVCISDIALMVLFGLLLLLLLGLLFSHLKRQRQIQEWRRTIWEGERMMLRKECPANLAKLQRENLGCSSEDMKVPLAQAMQDNAKAQEKLFSGRQLTEELEEIKGNVRRNKVTYKELETTPREFSCLLTWFQKHYSWKKMEE